MENNNNFVRTLVKEDSSTINTTDNPVESVDTSKIWGSISETWGWPERLVPDMLADSSEHQKFIDVHLKRYNLAVPYAKGKKVLDIASGTGYGSQMLSFAGASSVLGVDLSSDAIEYAQKNYQASNVKFICANAEEFEYPEKFDVITSFETIEHLPNPVRFLENLQRHLVPQGHLILSVPLGETRHYDPYHLHIFNQEQIFSLLEKTGFSVDFYRHDHILQNRSEIINSAKLFPDSNPSLRELLFSRRGWRALYDFIIRGGFHYDPITVVAHSVK